MPGARARGGHGAGAEPDLREVWDINKEKINGALAIAKAGYALQRAPTFYAELKIRYLTLTVPAQALQDETGKPLLDRAGKAVVLPEPMDVPIEFEVKPARVFYGQSGAVRNPGDKKRLTLSVDLSAKAFENQKWTSTALLAKTFDLGMAGPAISSPNPSWPRRPARWRRSRRRGR